MPSAWQPTRRRRPEAPPPRRMSRVHQQSLCLLIDAELSKQYAEEEGLEPSEGPGGGLLQRVRAAPSPSCRRSRAPCSRTCSRTGPRAAPCSSRPASEATGQQPSQENVEQLLNAGLQARAAWLKKADIETDPRYAPGEDGLPGGGDSSVSQPGSDFAKDAGAEEPDPEWVSGLPANQKCG